jgi:DNA-binding SARP family transcriptional activator
MQSTEAIVREGAGTAPATLAGVTGEHPVLICLLGDFQVLVGGRPAAIRVGTRLEALLANLALRPDYAASRDTLLGALWPDGDLALAGQSLHSLVYQVHKLVGDGLGGAPPVVHRDGRYRLNVEAGVSVDVGEFTSLANSGGRQAQSGNRPGAVECYLRAAHLYRGDLCACSDARSIVERERLRAMYLNLLAFLADDRFQAGDYHACLDLAGRLLDGDPCREDAHRIVMRCHVRRGERAQALRQYQLCKEILRTELDVAPEPATEALFEQVRTNPAAV